MVAFRAAAALLGDRLGSGAVIVQPAAEAEGAYCVTGASLAPRRLIPPHVHDTETQNVVVLTGTVGVWVAGEFAILEAGGFFVRPPRLPHAIFNPSDEPASFLEITSPGASFEQYLRAADGLTDRDAVAELAGRHGIRFVDDPLEDLRARYRLT
jgi:quercetin dioxygenase-like cupin family protein